MITFFFGANRADLAAAGTWSFLNPLNISSHSLRFVPSDFRVGCPSCRIVTTFFTAEEWAFMAKAGTVFVPAAGCRDVDENKDIIIFHSGTLGYYWTNNYDKDNMVDSRVGSESRNPFSKNI